MNLDAQLLLWINGHNSPWLDQLMWYASKPWLWVPLYVLLIAILWCKLGWKQALLWIALLAASAGLSDFISSGLIKNWVCRPRPTHEPTLAGLIHLVNGYRGGQYGFVSSHAANTCALATLFCLKIRDMKLRGQLVFPRVWYGVMGLFVLLNCYSRMYLGVHYPSDILGGLLVGLSVALLIYWITKLLNHKLQPTLKGGGFATPWDRDYSGENRHVSQNQGGTPHR